MNKGYEIPGSPGSIFHPDPPDSNVFKVTIYGRQENQVTINTFHYADSMQIGSASELELNDLLDQFASAVGIIPKFVACCSERWAIWQYGAECPTSPKLQPVLREVVSGGTIVGDCMPSQVCVTLAKKTAFRGKQGRGRISMPGVARSAIVDSVVAFPTAYNLLAGAMLTVYVLPNDNTVRPGLYAPSKRYTDGSITPESFVSLTDVQVRLTVGTCRSRKLGVGV